jgi:hypothetical protein
MSSAVLPEVDILSNNLEIYEPKDFVDIKDEDWFHIYEVNGMSKFTHKSDSIRNAARCIIR